MADSTYDGLFRRAKQEVIPVPVRVTGADLHRRRCLAELAHKVRVSGSMGHACTRTSPCAVAPHLANGYGRYSLRQSPTACLAQRGEVERGAAGLPCAHTPRRADLLRWQYSPSVPRQNRQFDLLGRWDSVELARLVRFCGVQASPLILIWRQKVEATVEERAVLVEQQVFFWINPCCPEVILYSAFWQCCSASLRSFLPCV